MASTRQVTLEIDPGGPPVRGRLRVPPDLVRSFSGWIGLLAALEDAIESENRPGPGRSSWSDHDDGAVEGS